MARKVFISWLFSQNKKPLYVDDATGFVMEAPGLTKPNGQPARLQKDPAGWKNVLVKYARNLKYLGLFREMSVPMKFVADGFTIVNNRRFTQGTEAVCYFAMDKLKENTYPPVYNTWYVSELDFTRYKRKKTECEVSAMEGGLSKILKASENITYEIPIDTDAEKKRVYLDGLVLTNTVTYEIYSGQNIFGNYFYVGAGITGEERRLSGIINTDAIAGEVLIDNYAKDFFFMRNDSPRLVSAKLKGSIKVLVKNTGSIALRIAKRSPFQNYPVNLSTFTFYNTADVPGGANLNIPFDLSINLSQGEFLTFEAIPNTVPSALNWYDITGGNFTVTYDGVVKATFAECLTPYRVFENLVSKMTNGKYGVQSNFLKTVENNFLTSGTALRKYGGAAVIKTSLQDFFQSFKKYGIGLSILKDHINGDKLVIEKHSHFFRNEVILKLGEVSNLETEEATDLLFKSIETGNDNYDYDRINGRDEFNVKQLWNCPVTRVKDVLDLKSIYRDDMYGIEIARIDLLGKDTTDNEVDNHVFRLDVEKGTNYEYYKGDFIIESVSGTSYIKIPSVLSALVNTTNFTVTGTTSNNGTYTVLNTSFLVIGYTIITVSQTVTNETVADGTIMYFDAELYHLNRPAYTSVTGLLNPAESYNLELSPKTSLLPSNNGGYLRSCLDYLDIEKIKFQTGDKNSELSRTLNGITITEKEDIEIGTLGDRLFRPLYFNFKTKVAFNFLEIINNNPYGLIEFQYQGQIYNGYLWDGGIMPATNDVQEWKLLCGPNVDLTKLI